MKWYRVVWGRGYLSQRFETLEEAEEVAAELGGFVEWRLRSDSAAEWVKLGVTV